MSVVRVLLMTLMASFIFICRTSAAPAQKKTAEQRKTVKQQRDLRDSMDMDYYKQNLKSNELISTLKPLTMSVYPQIVEPDQNQVATVSCMASIGSNAVDMPFINFYWLYDGHPVPITQSIPGVRIEPLDGEEGVYGQRLTITHPLYGILNRGANKFLCSASNISGQRVREEFVIKTYY